ncbi:MAG: T9SS-dependent M36 family metallopeptidase [Saprospiraceae bacterium]|nr:T9SS-dependent M36 family metallopeptidase [Saprospiraceae bacterium]
MKRIVHPLLLIGLFVLSTTVLQAQTPESLAVQYLNEHRQELGLTAADISSFRISDLYTNSRTGVTYLYLNQSYQGVDLLWATANAIFNQEGRLVKMNVNFEGDLAGKILSDQPALTPEDALRQCASLMDLVVPQQFEVDEVLYEPSMKTTFLANGWALENVPVKMVYYNAVDAGIRLAWEIDWYEPSADHRWYVLIDAATGDLLYKKDQVIHCDFGHPSDAHNSDCIGYAPRGVKKQKSSNAAFNILNPDSYMVFALPVESPNHGPMSVVTNPADPVASPFGWHDVDGAPGFEYTITRGNNVHAYQDTGDDNSSSGDEPDGGMELEFLFDYDQPSGPDSYQDAAVVNLFYWCNLMHDVWYQYGFDEQAGNFQENNYGNGGVDGDVVRAEAQDGSGLNNANFSSQGDGSGVRIQMYLWDNAPQNSELTIDEPMNIAGAYISAGANFGPGVPVDPLTDTLVLVNDGTADPTFGCEPIQNGAEVFGQIALIDRGTCGFVLKVLNAQDAGAVAVIICNDEPGDPIVLGGASTDVTIPAIMISQSDCELIKIELANTVVGTLQQNPGGSNFLDGDFDSGIISHEYGHGLSIRMTGGPSTGNCLSGAEQMGEGWSDYAGLMMTIEPGDAGEDVRGIGTFALGESTTGPGIRPAPYSTDVTVNDYTYVATNDVNNISQPHGIGFVWCTMLWEMTWDLIDLYGFDPDVYNGSAGNNIAMHLVTEGMKMQVCNPGFVDGRDAILLADEIFYGGVNRCLIWEAFARRGLGWSADQGSSGSRTDQVEAFDVPPYCLEALVPPTSQFSVDVLESCNGFFTFTDESFDIPQEWLWLFGDGGESNQISPSYTYTEEGTYTVQLIVTNTLGVDTSSIEVVVDFPDAPVLTTNSIEVCEGETATLEGDGAGVINWYLDGEYIGSGSPFETPPITQAGTIEAEVELPEPAAQGGPVDNNFGTGGYHNTTFTGTVEFEAHKAFILESVLMDAGDDGDRIIELFDAGGNVINSVTVFVPAGPSQVTLNLEVPSPGEYSVGATMMNLYRNDDGANYPYEVGDVATLTGSPAGPDFYYYLYNWVVRPIGCKSELVPVDVSILDGPTANFVTNQTEALVDFTDTSVDAISWSWNFGDGGLSSEQNPSYVYTESGTYSVTLTVSNGDCEDSYTQLVVVEIINGLAEVAGLSSFNLYPNLGNGSFYLELGLEQAEDIRVSVFNTQGQEVQVRDFNNRRTLQESFELGNLPSGVYLVRIGWRDQGITSRYVLIH